MDATWLNIQTDTAKAALKIPLLLITVFLSLLSDYLGEYSGSRPTPVQLHSVYHTTGTTVIVSRKGEVKYIVARLFSEK